MCWKCNFCALIAYIFTFYTYIYCTVDVQKTMVIKLSLIGFVAAIIYFIYFFRYLVSISPLSPQALQSLPKAINIVATKYKESHLFSTQ